MFGYDYDEVISKRPVESVEDIKFMSEEDKNRAAILIQNGVNSYEGLQNRQDSCIKLNVLYGYDTWVVPNLQALELNEKLKELKSELFNLRFSQATGSLSNPMQLHNIKKDIARINTILRERKA